MELQVTGAASRSILRRLNVGFVASVAPVGVSSGANPSDARSRDARLSAPGPRPAWSRRHFRHNGLGGFVADHNINDLAAHRVAGIRYTSREYFAGSAHLSQALCRRGLWAEVVEGISVNSDFKGGYDVNCDLDVNTMYDPNLKTIINREIDYFHSGIPCNTWCLLQYLNSEHSRT